MFGGGIVGKTTNKTTWCRFNKKFATACINGNPGVKRLYIGNYEDILDFYIDPITGVILSGLTCSGDGHVFYQIELLPEMAMCQDIPKISVENGSATSIPTVKFRIVQVNADTLEAYNQLKHGKFVAVYENQEGKLFILGLKRGLYLTAATMGTDESTFEGLLAELTGRESIGVFALSQDMIDKWCEYVDGPCTVIPWWGTSGTNGISCAGSSGTSGTSGTNGTSGTSFHGGTSGTSGSSATIANWKFEQNLFDTSGHGYTLIKSGSTDNDVYTLVNPDQGTCGYAYYFGTMGTSGRFLNLTNQIIPYGGTHMSPTLGSFHIRFLFKFQTVVPKTNIFNYYFTGITSGFGLGVNDVNELVFYKYEDNYMETPCVTYYIPKITAETGIWYYCSIGQADDGYIHCDIQKNFNINVNYYCDINFNDTTSLIQNPPVVGLVLGRGLTQYLNNEYNTGGSDYNYYQFHQNNLIGWIDEFRIESNQDWIDPYYWNLYDCYVTGNTFSYGSPASFGSFGSLGTVSLGSLGGIGGLFHNGSSGTSGICTNGTSGTSGTSGTNGTSAFVGSSGTNGTSCSGTSGTNGTTCTGTSGTDGTGGGHSLGSKAGKSGSGGLGSLGDVVSGSLGQSGDIGFNGTSGTSGSGCSSGTSSTSGACTSGTSGTNGTSHYVGEIFGGGTVFYTDGHTGLTVSTDNVLNIQWALNSKWDTIGTSTSYGSGNNNTTLIHNKYPSDNIAANFCYNLSYSGYSDWYMPSKDEFTILRNSGIINDSIHSYWCSSEVDNTYAWTEASNTWFSTVMKQNVNQYVVPIRTF